ncbi:MAG: class I SAM-dependent methyltransferase [Alphaproteobacteria bacterium]|nr:class I SAM-dependent methyltransferase [Alphaproteobacteria bacterium]MCB9692941.1 class I SAM-dependent methyltransferase [Alphaproteobacteria bacterium]
MNLDAAVARYLPQGKMAEGFARGKMKGDPAYAAVLGLLRPGMRVLDVGCGEGYLLALAFETLEGTTLHGFDHDARRLASAEAALAGTGATLWSGDARTTELPEVDAVCALDVLHYQPPEEQDAILARLVGALAPGGLLLVRDGRSDGGFKSTVVTWSERFAVALGRHKGDGVFFRPQDAMRGAMEALGLEVVADACNDQTPFANVLFVGRRP